MIARATPTMIGVSQEYLTPPQVAKMLGCKAEKVIGFIRRGELRAPNIADKLAGRPRYRIAAQDLQDFLDRRAAAAVETPRPPRRKRRRQDRPAGWISYYGMDQS